MGILATLVRDYEADNGLSRGDYQHGVWVENWLEEIGIDLNRRPLWPELVGLGKREAFYAQAARLFWAAYRPWLEGAGPDRPDWWEDFRTSEEFRASVRQRAEAGGSSLSSAYLAFLRDFENAAHSMVSDAIPGAHHYLDKMVLLAAVSASAAHAMALKRCQAGFSEDSIDCLKRALHIGTQLRILQTGPEMPAILGWPYFTEGLASDKLTFGIIQLELFEALWPTDYDGRSVRLLTDGLKCLSFAVAEAFKIPGTDVEHWACWVTRGRVVPPYRGDQYPDYSDRLELEELSTDVFVEYAMAAGARLSALGVREVLQRVLARNEAEDWAQLASDCADFAKEWSGLWDIHALVEDERGRRLSLAEYAHYAR